LNGPQVPTISKSMFELSDIGGFIKMPALQISATTKPQGADQASLDRAPRRLRLRQNLSPSQCNGQLLRTDQPLCFDARALAVHPTPVGADAP